MINSNKLKRLTTIFLLNFGLLSINASETTKEDSSAAAARPDLTIISDRMALYQADNSQSTPQRPKMTDEQLDACAAREYGRDLGLSEKLKKLDEMFKNIWEKQTKQSFDKK